MPPHLKVVYDGKNFALAHRLLELAVSIARGCDALVDKNAEFILSWKRKMINGISMDKEVEPCGFWRMLDSDEVEAKRAIAEEAARRSRMPPDHNHWAPEE
ncbi:unnamed protein product, partial [Amoebophrya sp. A25]|eukprot:GSA25T00027863001.1